MCMNRGNAGKTKEQKYSSAVLQPFHITIVNSFHLKQVTYGQARSQKY